MAQSCLRMFVNSSLKSQDPGFWTLDPVSRIQYSGSWILDPASRIQTSGYRILDPGCWIVNPGSCILDPGSWILDRIQDLGSRILGPGSRILDPGFRILDPGFWAQVLDPGFWIRHHARVARIAWIDRRVASNFIWAGTRIPRYTQIPEIPDSHYYPDTQTHLPGYKPGYYPPRVYRILSLTYSKVFQQISTFLQIL